MPSLKLTDDLGRTLVFTQPPSRVVSLVPSDTYNVIALGAADRLVGRTRFCTSPEAAAVTEVGGTKDVDVDAVVALDPHLVIANQEENTRAALEALAARGVPVLVSLPRRVADGLSHLARLGRILEVGATEPARSLIRRAYQLRDRTLGLTSTSPGFESPLEEPRRPSKPAIDKTPRPDVGRIRAFVPIWMDPMMTMNAETFGSDVLTQVGVANVFGDRQRLYPLAADLGKASPRDSSGRDIRYPPILLDEVVMRDPDVIILPDEPHAFSEADEAVFHAALPRARVVRVSGKDLFWYGAWTLDAIDRLAGEHSAG